MAAHANVLHIVLSVLSVMWSLNWIVLIIAGIMTGFGKDKWISPKITK